MNREKILELWKEFAEEHCRKGYIDPYNKYTDDWILNTDWTDYKDFLFDFINFIEKRFFEEYDILNEEDSRTFLNNMIKNNERTELNKHEKDVVKNLKELMNRDG